MTTTTEVISFGADRISYAIEQMNDRLTELNCLLERIVVVMEKDDDGS